jgi:hypothetical protein
MFWASNVHLQEALTSSFWCELRVIIAVGWLWVGWFIGFGGVGVGPVACDLSDTTLYLLNVQYLYIGVTFRLSLNFVIGFWVVHLIERTELVERRV